MKVTAKVLVNSTMLEEAQSVSSSAVHSNETKKQRRRRRLLPWKKKKKDNQLEHEKENATARVFSTTRHRQKGLPTTNKFDESHASTHITQSTSDEDEDASSTGPRTSNAYAHVRQDLPRRTIFEGPLVWSDDNIDFTIRYWKLSKNRIREFYELKERLSDFVSIQPREFRPDVLIRYLAHHGSVDKAEAGFRESMKWRKINQVNEMVDTYRPPPILLKYCPGALLQHSDRDGDGIFLSRTGATDFVGLLQHVDAAEFVKFEVWKREFAGTLLREQEKHTGRPVNRCLIIDDMEGLSSRQMATRVISLFGEVMKMDQDNYCETSKKIIVVRAPAVFRVAWSIGKNFFPQHIIDKMDFCSSNNYLQVLDNYMNIEHLPPCLYEKGKGRPMEGTPTGFDGGRVPPPKKK